MSNTSIATLVSPRRHTVEAELDALELEADEVTGSPATTTPRSSATSPAALWEAASHGDVSLVSSILSLSPDVLDECKSSSLQERALHVACRRGGVEVVTVLLDAGADLEACEGQGLTPLDCAAKRGRQQVVDLLLARGAHVDGTVRGLPVRVPAAGSSSSSSSAPSSLPGREMPTGRTPVYLAARNGHAAVVRQLAAAGARLDLRKRNGWAPLHAAARNGHVDAVTALIEGGAAVDALEAEERTPLFIAARNGHPDVVRVLIDAKASVDTPSVGGVTALHVAASSGFEDVVRVLVHAGSSMDATDSNGRTPLYSAARANHVGTVHLLLEAGAAVDSTTLTGRTALDSAAKSGRMELARVCLDAGASINQAEAEGRTALYLAVENEQFAMARMLVDAGADVNASDRNGWAPIHVVSHKGFADIATLLLDNNADFELTDAQGHTPLFVAATHGNEAVVRLLLDRGADLSTPASGVAPLHAAIQAGHEQVTRLLLANGADYLTPTNDGWSPLHIAAQEGHADIVQTLIDLGAEPDVAKDDGRTPLFVAARGGHAAVVRLLLAAGASVESEKKNPLHIAAKKGHAEVVRLLVQAGASAHTPDSSNATPLQIASKKGHDSVQRVLVESSFTSALMSLSELISTGAGDDSALATFREHIEPARQHVEKIVVMLSSCDATVANARSSVLDAGSPIGNALERSERSLAKQTRSALRKANQAALSHEDKAQLNKVRNSRISIINKAERAVVGANERAAELEFACKQLTDFAATLDESLGPLVQDKTVPPNFRPCAVGDLKSFVSSSADTAARLTKLQLQARRQAEALSATLQEIDSLSSSVTSQLTSSLRIPHEADLSTAVPKALYDNVTSRIRYATHLSTSLNESGKTVKARLAELRQLKLAVEADLADVAAIPRLEDRVVAKRHEFEDAMDELEELQTRLRRLVRRNRLTESERVKHDKQVAEYQRRVAWLRRELEAIEGEVEALTEFQLPEAVNVLMAQRHKESMPEVLLMLQQTGLCRNRNLDADYESVEGIHLPPARYQMRLVRPVGTPDIKVLKAFPSDLFKRIRNEVVNVTRVGHPNVMRPELVFLEPVTELIFVQYPYLPLGSLDNWLLETCIMKHMQGEPLLSRRGHELLRGVFREVVDGVCHLHQNGVVHNDVKPGNVLMDDHERPVICDFELSTHADVAGTREVGSMTVHGMTVSYAAPEVVENKRSTEKSDMYSLGRLMYDMLLYEWLEVQLAPTASMPDEVHPAFRDLVSALLSEDPDLRPSALEARAHPFFTRVLFEDEEHVPRSIKLDLETAVPERRWWSSDGTDPSNHRVALDLRCPEAVDVVTDFRLRGCRRRRIVRVERIENAELLRRFAFHKRHLAEKYGEDVEERLLFHGTKPQAVGPVVDQGFDMRLNGANGSALGRGSYFAADSAYSAGNTYSPPDADGVKWIFVARILVGKTVEGMPDMRRAERPDGTVVDTAVDYVDNPRTFVTFDNGQALPVYLIGFK